MAPEESPQLQGLRVLIIEDEVLVSMLVEEMCADFGCEVVGPFATLDTAMAACDAGGFDVAVVDLHLAGMSAEPVLASLRQRAVPFAIMSGAGQSAEAGNELSLNKPFSFDQFGKCMTALAELTD